MPKIIEWMKAHPYSTGAIVIGGGLVFFTLSGLGGGGTSSANAAPSSKPSDAEVMAGAQIQAAQIAAQAQSAGYSYALEGAKIQAQYAALESEYNFLLGKEQIAASKEMYAIGAQTSIVNSYLDSATTLGIIALSNPITTTTSSSKKGFLGIGGKSSSTTTQTPQNIPLPNLSDVIGQIQLPGQSNTAVSAPSSSISISTGSIQIPSQF